MPLLKLLTSEPIDDAKKDAVPSKIRLYLVRVDEGRHAFGELLRLVHR